MISIIIIVGSSSSSSIMIIIISSSSSSSSSGVIIRIPTHGHLDRVEEAITSDRATLTPNLPTKIIPTKSC